MPVPTSPEPAWRSPYGTPQRGLYVWTCWVPDCGNPPREYPTCIWVHKSAKMGRWYNYESILASMKVYWRERRSGQSLILSSDEETEVEVGMVRRTPRGFDAVAKTNTYDPGRAKRGLASMEEAKAFVESFHPWDLFGGDRDLRVDPELRRTLAENSRPTTVARSQPMEPAVPEHQLRKRWWEFWRS